MSRNSNTVDLPAWSPSALQRITTCGYSYYQRYVLGHTSRQHAAAWFGSEIVHRFIQLAYDGLPLEQCFETVWNTACAPIVPALQAWLELDRDFRLMKGTKRSDSKDAVAWLKGHPEYIKLHERIGAYQRTTLSAMRWNDRTSLADYYRRASVLLDVPSERWLLANPWMVEGQWLQKILAASSEGEEADTAFEDEEKVRTYSLLEGTIGGISVHGVPDVVAMREDGMMLIGDYKTSAKPPSVAQLAVNMQLLIYYELLQQNGIVPPKQVCQIGHIYLTESDVVQIWTDTSQFEMRLPLIERQLQHAERRRAMDDFVPVAGIATSFSDPCPTCDMAHICDAVLFR